MLECADVNLADLIPSWERHLRAKNLAGRTIASYLEAARLFDDWLAKAEGQGLSLDAREVKQEHIENYLDSILSRASASFAATHFRRLQQLWRWLTDEEEIDLSPMRRMSPPRIPEQPVPIVPENDLRALLAACEGKEFVDRRDTAIVRVLIDCGVRASELVGLTVTDVDWDYSVIVVVGKGRRRRSVPFGKRTSASLDRYLRSRRTHRWAELDALWIGSKGPLTTSGVTQLVERRCMKAGIPAISLHRFRHSAAHAWLASGGQEGDLERLMGWSARGGMVKHYAKSAADQRALDAHRRLGLADRL